MRYHNPNSELRIDLSNLDSERKRFYQSAVEKFDRNIDWLEFEEFAFSFNSPVFKTSRNRSEVLSDPLYLVLKDMWLRLGIRQGMVAPAKETVSANTRKSRQAGSHIPTHRSDMAIADKPAVSRRRGR
jgi:hypothetical protein